MFDFPFKELVGTDGKGGDESAKDDEVFEVK